MSKPVLFVTGLGRKIERAENLVTLYRAYNGEKKIMSMNQWGYSSEEASGKYDVMVVDIFPTVSHCKTIMMWHAIQGGKKVGLGQRGTYYKPEYAQYMDRIVCAGHGAVDMFHDCTNVPKEYILNLGMPRTDKYIGKKKGNGNTVLADKKSYLFVPTFRASNETPFPMIDWKYIDEHLTDDELFVLKTHPYDHTQNVEGYKHIIQIPCMESTTDYLYDCDVLITDYSSTMFDGWLLNKPCVLFEKHPGYTFTRGMYMNYPMQYSDRYATCEEGLLEQIRAADSLTETEIRCRDYVADACDGHSCERICKLIDEMNGGKE